MEYAQVALIRDRAQLIVCTGGAVGHRRGFDISPDDNTRDSPNTSVQSATNAFQQEA
jgi:hypothetical protein